MPSRHDGGFSRTVNRIDSAPMKAILLLLGTIFTLLAVRCIDSGQRLAVRYGEIPSGGLSRHKATSAVSRADSFDKGSDPELVMASIHALFSQMGMLIVGLLVCLMVAVLISFRQSPRMNGSPKAEC